MSFTAPLFAVINAADIVFVGNNEVNTIAFAESYIEVTLPDGEYTKVVFVDQNVTVDDAGEFSVADKKGVLYKVRLCSMKALTQADLPG